MESLNPLPPETREAHTSQEKPLYTPPKIVVMDDAEVLSAFQVTQAATSWWVM